MFPDASLLRYLGMTSKVTPFTICLYFPSMDKISCLTGGPREGLRVASGDARCQLVLLKAHPLVCFLIERQVKLTRGAKGPHAASVHLGIWCKK